MIDMLCVCVFVLLLDWLVDSLIDFVPPRLDCHRLFDCFFDCLDVCLVASLIVWSVVWVFARSICWVMGGLVKLLQLVACLVVCLLV